MQEFEGLHQTKQQKQQVTIKLHSDRDVAVQVPNSYDF